MLVAPARRTCSGPVPSPMVAAFTAAPSKGGRDTTPSRDAHTRRASAQSDGGGVHGGPVDGRAVPRPVRRSRCVPYDAPAGKNCECRLHLGALDAFGGNVG